MVRYFQAFDVITTSQDVSTSDVSSATWSAGTMLSESVTTTITGTSFSTDVSSAITAMATSFSPNFSETTTHVFDTYGYFIHPHWRNFPLVPDHWHYLIGVCITLVGFTGIIGNSTVIYMFTRYFSQLMTLISAFQTKLHLFSIKWH